jgi:hypothetical protein
MTTFNITINKLYVLPVEEEQKLENVVQSVDYIVHGKDGDYRASVVRNVGLGSPNKTLFKPLDALTEQDLINFVHSSVALEDIKCLELEVQEAIDRMKNPVQSVVSMQWPLNN